MISRLSLIRNVGQFDNVASATSLTLRKGSLIYAENGRGKTTIASILRSFGTGDSRYIDERYRLGATSPPHIIIQRGSGSSRFDNGLWSYVHPALLVFDDIFVEENVCSGLEVAPDHRKNLHEVVVGSQGVNLARAYRVAGDRGQELNKLLRQQASSLQAQITPHMTVDEYCELMLPTDADEQFARLEKAIVIQENAVAIQQRESLQRLQLRSIDISKFEALLGISLENLDQNSVSQVEDHLARLGDEKSRQWVKTGLDFVNKVDESQSCPFCAQNLGNSDILSHYRGYFSHEYTKLVARLDNAQKSLGELYSDQKRLDLRNAFQRLSEDVEFWRKCASLPELPIDLETLDTAWVRARPVLEHYLALKRQNPLERLELKSDDLITLQAFNRAIAQVEATYPTLDECNALIAQVKAKSSSSSSKQQLQARLARLKAAKQRHSSGASALCTAYLETKRQKIESDQARDQVKRELEHYRTNIFPGYQEKVNHFLRCLGAEFELQSLAGTNSNAGASCTYSVVVNNLPVSVTRSRRGEPAFRSLLSAGDRSTLALAFFLAAVEFHPRKAELVIVFDDPMSSLDQHRKSATVEQLYRLHAETSQLIVLSHNKAFLIDVWTKLESSQPQCIVLERTPSGSGFAAWQIDEDRKTENDRRYARFIGYLRDGPAEYDLKVIAADLRLHLEHYLRATSPGHFRLDSLLGGFIERCKRDGTILRLDRLTELTALKDYANRFHHGTNEYVANAPVIDGELQAYVRRVLEFTKP